MIPGPRRLEKQALVEVYDKKLHGAPSWWPDLGEREHMGRLRAAEKVVLAEVYGPPPPPKSPRFGPGSP